MTKRRITPVESPVNYDYLFEAEVIEGLETIAITEIEQRLSSVHIYQSSQTSGAIQFNYTGDIKHLEHLRSIIAVYRVLHFAVPRPRALLGHQHFTILIQQINNIRNRYPNEYHSFTISAAGSESSVIQRLRKEIAAHTGLHFAVDSGDLLIRLRRPINRQDGWEVLLRLTPRPLSVRDYRAVNFPGAVNSTVAYAIATLLQPQRDQMMLNLACGSGTILIEYQQLASAGVLIGCDIDAPTLAIATANIRAGGHNTDIHLLLTDARRLPFPDNSIDVLCADLPFGQLVGSHENNQMLYPAVLTEAARVARPAARCIILSHEIKLMERLLTNNPNWRQENNLHINLRGLHPRLFILRRK